MACDLEVVGQILTTCSAVVLGACAGPGVYLMPNGSVSLGGNPAVANEIRTNQNRRRYLRSRYGLPAGWALFAAGSIAQLAALLMK